MKKRSIDTNILQEVTKELEELRQRCVALSQKKENSNKHMKGKTSNELKQAYEIYKETVKSYELLIGRTIDFFKQLDYSYRQSDIDSSNQIK